jgi:hypothetical protein
MSEELKLTPIDQIEDMADGVPVLAVEGTVKFAQEIKNGTSTKGVAWTKQFFVLTNGTAEIACSMWDAEGNELSKGETVHIENTQNKKGVWSGMIKGSYQKNGERKHTLEIRANQVKITSSDSIKNKPQPAMSNEEIDATYQRIDSTKAKGELFHEPIADPDWPEAPATAPELPLERPNGDVGVMEARKHLMKACNLYNLCIKAAVTSICPNIPDEQRTNEQFQSTLASLWIEASSRRCTDGVNWWSFIDRMPDKPL